MFGFIKNFTRFNIEQTKTVNEVEKEQVSERLIHQRLRNRIIEAVSIVCEGDEIIREIGAAEYFNTFFDFEDCFDDPNNPCLSTLNFQETKQLFALNAVMHWACSSTDNKINDLELIQSGWPKKIIPFAKETLELLLIRGRHSEDFEEQKASFELGQEWLKGLESYG